MLSKSLGALLLGCAFFASPAEATILFAGGEDVDFNCTAGACTVTTTAGNYRSSWAREAYTVGTSVTDPPTNRIQTPAFAGQTDFWIHWQWCPNTNSSCTSGVTGSANAQSVRLIDGSGNPTLIMRATTTVAGVLKFSSRTSGGAFTDLVTCNTNGISVGLQQMDLHVVYGASGSINLYNNSASICTFSGDTRNGDGATTITQVEFSGGINTGGPGGFSEVIIADGDTRAKNLYRLTPNAAGNTAGSWVGANPCTAIVNASTINDGTFVSDTVNNDLLECATTNSIPAGSWNVDAMVMSARVLVGSTGPQHFDFVTRTGGSDFVSSDFTPGTSFANFPNYIQGTNPNTSTLWTTGDLTAAGFNIGLKSRP
jgi:hypothetical protein